MPRRLSTRKVQREAVDLVWQLFVCRHCRLTFAIGGIDEPDQTAIGLTLPRSDRLIRCPGCCCWSTVEHHGDDWPHRSHGG